MAEPEGLTDEEIMALVYDYIGVTGDGYLRGFSYNTHQEFYPRYCNFRVDVARARKEHGTTRNTFLGILRAEKPERQARIVEGTFKAFPLESFSEEERPGRTAAMGRLSRAVARLRGQAVQVDDLALSNETVERAIQDADVLIREQGNTSGVDRVHTALHGYLRALCAEHGVATEPDTDAAKLMKMLRTQVPAFHPGKARVEEIGKLQGALATIVDSLSPIRNRASLAHPNDALLEPAEAALAIDAARSVLNYLNRKHRSV